MKVLINHRDQPCPLQWKKYLSLDENKVALVSFLVKEWSRPEYAASLQHRSLFVTHGNYCTKMSSTDGLSVETSAVVELECTHEEADTRMLFHAAHASSRGSRTIVIRSPDTDVAFLAVVLCQQFAQGSRMFFRTGTKHRVRYIYVFALRRKLGEQVSDALLGLHSLTGCDSTSPFKNRGKKPGLELLISNPGLCEGLQLLGQNFEMPQALMELCERFVCLLYRSSAITDVNKLRYHIFAPKASPSDQLPPTKDALYQHVLRANYQASIWQRALYGKPEIPSPNGHGREVTSEQHQILRIKWMTQALAPEELLLLVNCHCRTGCTTGRCSCV